MEYGEITAGRFLDRPNRFIAHVETGGTVQVCHVKNTGRCRELLVPGRTVYLERSANPARKTAFDLIAADKGGGSSTWTPASTGCSGVQRPPAAFSRT